MIGDCSPEEVLLNAIRSLLIVFFYYPSLSTLMELSLDLSS
jgi:hypothetical protein